MEQTTYLKEIETAYQAEVRGEATFSTLAELATSPDEVAIWRTLARAEATARQRLIPLMQRHRIITPPDEEQKRRGRERDEKRAATGFSAAVKSMTETLLPYLTLYGRPDAEDPAEDRKEPGRCRYRGAVAAGEVIVWHDRGAQQSEHLVEPRHRPQPVENVGTEQDQDHGPD